ncbi:MAG: N-acetylmuramoyl-L-alanine amidase [Bacteroidota bacterium]
MRNFVFLLITFIFSSSFISADQKPKFHQVVALAGDNIPTLLARYQLHEFRCNIDQFHKLNQTSEESKIKAGKKYKIPVFIYDYDGKSIRSTVGLDSWSQAVRIKQYNEFLLENDLRRKTILGSGILWVPFHELNCLDKKLSEGDAMVFQKARKVEKKIAGARKFSIFGKKYAHVPLTSNKLSGKVFYVVSGHGGPDSGAVGKRGKTQMCEDEYAYDIALRLTRNLIANGAVAYMITRDPDDGIRDENLLKCDVDEYCWGDYAIPLSQKQRLFQRSNAVNHLFGKYQKIGVKDENQTTIILHIDSRAVGQRADVFFYHYPNSEPSFKLATKIKNKLAQKYKRYRKNGQYSGYIKARDLHMLRETKGKSVYIELGNIRNKDDQRRFMRDNRQALANWLYEALAN